MGGTVQIFGNNPNELGFWWENLMERDHVEDLGLDGG